MVNFAPDRLILHAALFYEIVYGTILIERHTLRKDVSAVGSRKSFPSKQNYLLKLENK